MAPEWVLISLAGALNYSGKFEEAVAEYERELARPPSSTFHEWWTRLDLSLALEALGRVDEARAQLALAIELNPDLSTIEARRIEYRLHEDQSYAEGLLATFRRLGMPEE